MEATRLGDAPFLADRFRAQWLLKQGKGVDTWLAVDEDDGDRPVVLKMVAAAGVNPSTRARLEHEAQVLARLETVSFRPLVAWGRDGDTLFLVQPFVEGVTLEERLATGSLDAGSALRMGIDVLSDLALAHEQGVLHRDVKPTNVMVNGDTPLTGPLGPAGPLQRAVLIDFGLAKSAGLDPSVRDEPVGTARYLAPEASGLLDVVADERADLYSFGVLLFESLAGRPPFEATNVGEVLRAHLTTPAPLLRSLGVAVPRALDEVIARLLRKDPGERYQSAHAVLADLEQIAEALEQGMADPQVTAGLHDRRIALTEASFVGRATELRTLTRLLSAASEGRGGLVLLEAESGGGKSRLLDELALEVGLGAWTLRGQGLDQAAQHPFQLLDGVAATILATAAENPVEVERLTARLGDRVEAVVAALPALGAVLGPAEPDELGPEAYGEVRSIEALRSLLGALGEPGRPALVLLDDCQWSDGLTARLLARWNERSDGACHVLVVAAFRSEEVGPGHALRSLRPRAAITLGPFDPANIGLLCTSMAGTLPAEALEVVVHLAEGSPFMASAVLRGMVESGALRWVDDDTVEPGSDGHAGARTTGGWQIEPGPMAVVQTSRRAALFLVRRLELLSSEVLELLGVGAVLGKEFDLGLASELSGRSAGDATEVLQEARRRHILWVDERSGCCTFCHDKLRDALLTRLSADERRDLHRRAARRLEETSPDGVFELAYHYDAGGEGARALDYALRAAEAARPQYALEMAAAHYRVAERWASGNDPGGPRPAPPATRARIAEGLGDVLVLQGQYAEAATRLEEALALTADRVARVALETQLGDLAFKRGDPLAARNWLEGALRHLGRWAPRRTLAFLVALLWEVVVQAVHTLAPRVRHRRNPDNGEDDLLAVRIYSRLAYVYWFHSGKVTCGWAHLREMNLAERYPPSSALAQAYSEHAPATTMVPWYRRGKAYSRQSLAIRRDLGDLWGQGQSLSFYGVVLYAASSYRECIDTCREAIRLLQRTGDRWEEHTATWHLAYCHYRLGELDKAVELARSLHASAVEIGDSAAAGISLSVWSKASGGGVPAALVATEMARGDEDAHTSTEVHLAEAIRLLGAGLVDDAVVVLDAAVGIIRGAGLRQEYVVPVYPWLATARRLQAEAVPAIAAADREKAVAVAAKAANRACRLARRYRNSLPHALREQALVAALAGKPARAQRLLTRSLAVAAEQEAHYEWALTIEAGARLGAALGWAQATDAVANAAARVVSFFPRSDGGAGPVSSGQPASLDLTDRFASLLEVSRTIGSAPSEDGVWDAVRHAAINVLRGERCYVAAVHDGGADLTTVSGEGLGDVSRNLVARAVASNAPVVSGESESDDVSESMVLSGVRSSLCAPVRCEDRVVACFTVTHRQVDGLFGDEEVQLAEFVATLAGAALEHVAGSEARYRSLALNSTDVVTIVDAKGMITHQSSSVSRVFGFEPAELVGQCFSSWLHPDDREMAVAFQADAARAPAGGSMLVQCRLRHRDGSWRHVETAVNNLLRDPGVRGIVLNTRDVSDRVALEAELRKQAWHDGLTGLANRALFTDRVNHAIARQARSWSPLSVLFLDLDDFKSLNDTMGHGAGDVVLGGVARRLEECIRPGDTVARFGGDEFAVLLESADQADAERVATRILEQLDAPFAVSDRDVKVRASLGVAVAAAGDSRDDETGQVDELLGNADAAMYVAKTRGKNRFEVFEAGMRTAAIERSGLRTDLGWALERRQLEVHYQPVIDIATGAVAGFEALVRWHHPQRGLLLPGEFIDLAEESGLIVPIGTWVLSQACWQAREWSDAHDGERLTMAVNVSARQLHDSGLASAVSAALAASGIDPATLVLEITESVTVADTDITIARLRALKDLGVGLAIDDFGTGYSSLSYLRRFPVDLLKIDRSFVAGVGRSPEDSAIVSSVVGLAHAFGLKVVAEGVETVEQLEVLTRFGCDYAQGYNWRRPAPAGDVERWLQSALFERVPRPDALRVVIADDRASVRAAIRLAMEVHGGFRVVGEAADGQQATELARRHQPDLVVLDLVMPDHGGLEALPGIRRVAPRAGVVLLTAQDLGEVPSEAVAESIGLFDKTADLSSLVDHLAGAALLTRA